MICVEYEVFSNIKAIIFAFNTANKNVKSNIKKSKMHLILELGIVAGILLLVLLISFANKINQKSER
ncbi:hypothetical protein C8C85_3182 [Flavobacterium sp. 103]|nr:hypothetical protein C8C85_3182 [Flavobacterium sp. 103]